MVYGEVIVKIFSVIFPSSEVVVVNFVIIAKLTGEEMKSSLADNLKL